MPGIHLPLISPKLNDYDVVMTQEDFDWWAGATSALDFVHYHERLRADVTHKYQTEKHPGPDAVMLDLDRHPAPFVGDGLGFLSRYAFRDVVRVPWPSCFGGVDGSDMGAGDCLAMKGFMVATFTLAKNVEVDIYTLHLEAGATETDQMLQAEDMLVLADFMATHSKSRAVILGGDTNLHTAGDHPDSSGDADGNIWDAFIQVGGLTDACAALDCAEPGAIDKIAIRSSKTVALEVTERSFKSSEFVGTEGEALSDHEPLSVTVRWTGR